MMEVQKCFFLLRILQRKRENKKKDRFHTQSNNSGHSSFKVVGTPSCFFVCCRRSD